MKFFKNIFILLFAIIFLSGCNIKSSDMEDINIYTTIYPINYLIESLYGKHSNIYSIYPLGVNLDNYELSERKIKEYSKSDLFIFNSLDEDRDRDYAVKMINYNSKLKVIDVSTGMDYNNVLLKLNGDVEAITNEIKSNLSGVFEDPESKGRGLITKLEELSEGWTDLNDGSKVLLAIAGLCVNMED